MDTAVKKPIKFTYEDYLHFPEDKRYEIIDGEVHMVPSPVPYHQMVFKNNVLLKNSLGFHGIPFLTLRTPP